MKDSFGREINYMRISLTDRCNFRCRYCMPEEGVADIGHDHILTLEEIERIAAAAASLGVSKFRLTGGEPLVRKGVAGLVKNLAALPGVSELAMTTNGSLLADRAQELKAAGLSRVNISLDTLRPDRFQEITRGGSLDDVIGGINAATDAGLKPVKLNVVIMKGFNDDEILDFVQLTFQHEYEIRFIELMPIGQAAGENGYPYLSCEEIKAKLPALRPIAAAADEEGGVAERFKYPGARGTLGFITPISNCFCSQCNKLRLTPDGKLKTCLHSNKEIDLRPALEAGDGDSLRQVIREAVLAKEERHHLAEGAEPIARDMFRIGG